MFLTVQFMLNKKSKTAGKLSNNSEQQHSEKMKILCETNVVRRSGSNLKGRLQKSTLAIGKKNEDSNLCIILITSSNKSGTKYGKQTSIFVLVSKLFDSVFYLKISRTTLTTSSESLSMKENVQSHSNFQRSNFRLKLIQFN